MKRLLILIIISGQCVMSASAQVIPWGQGATIWFYRPANSPEPRYIPMLLEVGGITRRLARLAPGEFFGYSLGPGIHVFSYTRAPARGESLLVPIKEGDQAFVEVHFRELKQVQEAEGIEAIQQLRPMSVVKAIDKSVFVDSIPVKTAAETMAPVIINESASLLKAPTHAPLPPPSGISSPPGPVRDRPPFQTVDFSETFTKVILDLEVDGRIKEIDANVKFDKNAFVVIDRKDGTLVKTFSYSDIRTGEYSFGKSPRWKAALLVSPLFLFTSGEKHWFMVEADNDYALMQLDKSNYKLLLSTFEARTGVKVETVTDSE